MHSPAPIVGGLGGGYAAPAPNAGDSKCIAGAPIVGGLGGYAPATAPALIVGGLGVLPYCWGVLLYCWGAALLLLGGDCAAILCPSHFRPEIPDTTYGTSGSLIHFPRILSLVSKVDSV